MKINDRIGKMDFYKNVIVDRKGIKNVYESYLVRAMGIYFDDISSLQLIYVVEGSVSVFLDGEMKEYSEGDLIILNQFDNKFLYTEGENLLFIIKISSKYLKSLGKVFYVSRFINHQENKETNNKLLKNMLLLFHTEDEDTEENDLNIIYQTLQLIMKNYICMDCMLINIEEKSDYLLELERQISRKSADEISLNNLADELHLSSSYVSKIFNEMSGINFTEYLQQMKLFYSTTYLLNTRDTLENIAGIVGFGSTKSLNRIYNKYFDLTPSEYREKYKKKAEKLNDNSKFLNLYENFDSINYSSYIEEENSKLKNSYKIDLSKKKDYGIYKKWSVIRNLKSLGINYLETLKELTKAFKINEIMLLFSIDYETKELRLVHLDKVINGYELNNLLSFCIEHEIVPVISLELKEFKFIDNINDFMSSRINKMKYFYDVISKAVGITNMKKFTYLINIGEITQYMDDPKNLEVYSDFVAKQQYMLADKLGTQDYVWGYELGNVNDQKSEKIKILTNMFKHK